MCFSQLCFSLDIAFFPLIRDFFSVPPHVFLCFFFCFRSHSFSLCVVICTRQKSVPFSNRYGNAFASRNAILKSNVYVTNVEWEKKCNYVVSVSAILIRLGALSDFCRCFFVLRLLCFIRAPFLWHSEFFFEAFSCFHVLLDSFLVFVALLHSRLADNQPKQRVSTLTKIKNVPRRKE